MTVIKYIIQENGIPILFSKEIVHNKVHAKARSAGFLAINYDHKTNRFKAYCFGESTSLNVKSNGVADKKIIEDYLITLNTQK